jgi:quinol monooxygenase YgiN
MYGSISRMVAAENQRDALIDTILGGVDSMPGCLSYIVSKDAENPDAIWITEVWDSKASHEASLSLPVVRAAIERAMPLIAGFEEIIVTEPVGGTSLPTP